MPDGKGFAMKESVCPKCGSTNVGAGSVVLACFDCGWNHNNHLPCEVCGQPSVCAFTANGSPGVGRCKDHRYSARQAAEIMMSLVDELREAKKRWRISDEEYLRQNAIMGASDVDGLSHDGARRLSGP